MIICSECGTLFESMLAACPNCGCPNEKRPVGESPAQAPQPQAENNNQRQAATGLQAPVGHRPEAHGYSGGENNLSAETTLNVIAYIILVVGIIAAIVIFFHTRETAKIIECYQDGSAADVYRWQGIGNSLEVAVISVALWALMRVISNISATLKEMKIRCESLFLCDPEALVFQWSDSVEMPHTDVSTLYFGWNRGMSVLSCYFESLKS